MTEDQLTRMLRARIQPAGRKGLVLGIGDDCAIFRPRGAGEDLVFTTDLLVEDVHFRAATHRPQAVGWKALARGLSDIAAMGAQPRFCLLSLALPEWAGRKWVSGFYDGFLRLAGRCSVVLAGGDLARAAKVACDIVVCGSLPRGTALLRSGARPGDALYVSGTLGGSALGLATRRGPAWQRHLWPEPRLELGRFLRAKLRATSAMDLSDGISLDLRRLCRESKVSAELNAPLPVFHGAGLEEALDGGEDYELLFTVRPGVRVPERRRGIPLTRIGTMREGRAGRVTLFGSPLAPRGFDHLRA
jgi:thiamine-monophosphate kinase